MTYRQIDIWVFPHRSQPRPTMVRSLIDCCCILRFSTKYLWYDLQHNRSCVLIGALKRGAVPLPPEVSVTVRPRLFPLKAAGFFYV